MDEIFKYIQGIVDNANSIKNFLDTVKTKKDEMEVVQEQFHKIGKDMEVVVNEVKKISENINDLTENVKRLDNSSGTSLLIKKKNLSGNVAEKKNQARGHGRKESLICLPVSVTKKRISADETPKRGRGRPKKVNFEESIETMMNLLHNGLNDKVEAFPATPLNSPNPDAPSDIPIHDETENLEVSQ